MGLFDMAKNFTHSRELKESKDEIFVGELINYMYKNGAVLIDIQTDNTNNHSLTFKFVNHPILNTLKIGVSRKVEGLVSSIVGSQTILSIQAIIRNEVVEPEDIIKMYHTDFKNMFKVPMFGNVKVNHDLNYIIAETSYIVDLNKFVSSDGVDKESIFEKLNDIINTLSTHLEPLKKTFE